MKVLLFLGAWFALAILAVVVFNLLLGLGRYRE
jgi:hypothetical protein